MRRRNTILLVILGLLLVCLACSPEPATMATQVAPEDATASQAGPAGSPSAPQAPPTITGISVASGDQASRVVLTGNMRLSYTSFMLGAPPAIVIDIGAEADGSLLGLSEVESPVIEKVEVGQMPGRQGFHRVTLHLKEKSSYKIVREGLNLVVLVDQPMASAMAGQPEAPPVTTMSPAPPVHVRPGDPPHVAAIDFLPVGASGASRLSVKTTSPVKPRVAARDQGGTVLLTLNPAMIADALLRPLDTRYHNSAVDMVRPMRLGQGVQLAIKLRQAVPYHLNQEDGLITIDFDPSTQAAPPLTLPAAPRAPAMDTGSKGGKPAMDANGGQTQDVVSASGKIYTGKRITLDFQNADIHNILRLIGEVSGKNVVISDRVSGKVTLSLKQVPWDQALDIILASQNLGMQITGNVLRIEDINQLAAEKERLAAERLAEEEKRLLLATRIWTPKYASVENMKNLLEPLKTDKGSIRVVGNDIFVKDVESALRIMDEVFQKNDRVAKQVLIEARIVEALTSFTKNLGLNWGGTWNDPRGTLGGVLGNNSLGGSLSIGGLYGASNHAVNLISPPSTGLGLGLSFATAALNLDVNLYAMEQTGEGRIISAPRILANDNEDVYIKQGQSIPYETTGTASTPSSISYNEAVLELRVKPHIEDNEEIISMEIKVTKDTPDYSRTTRNPPINKREAQTKLMVRDGETVVIGGIIVDEKSKSINRVPGLHKVPILGWLFKNYQIQDSKVELLIFITAHIIPVRIQ